ncbi:hypothetical protein [Mesorhizobium sp. CA12]|uniref:hypothetical protein n=1 Tax=Mesorhizobium sp. CA12 TaxID=2876644 RepID=UPI001CCE851C|nr:hypothetical protein [Mesorhizobium sp. CA12]MBZ9860859.1 hypothetical protein [Mesorhizobium sp. CA12]
MKIFVGLVAADQRLRRHFGLGKDAIIPKDALNKGFFYGRGVQILQSTYIPDGAPTANELERFILSRAKEADACLLIMDADLLHLAADIRNSVFIVSFQNADVGASLQNFFHYTTARALKALGQILARFYKGEDGDLLMLPLRNFQAGELVEIARLCREENLQPNFGDLIERQLVPLRGRLRPRRRTSYKTIYAVDDAKRFFVYGKERHAKFATGGEHGLHCEIAGHLRFGKRIDADRHFNVSETEGDETSISGVFRDCHNAEREVKTQPRVTHLNMFANDYF